MPTPSYCSGCGSRLEDDCDFCTNCGAPKPEQQANQVSLPPAPHQWMQAPPPPGAGGQPRTGDLAPRPVHHPVPSQPTYQAAPFAPPAQVFAVAAGPNSVLLQAGVPFATEKTAVAQISLVVSIIMLSLAVVALVPCLGWANWLNLVVLAEVQHIAWWISFFRERGPTARRKRLLSLPFFLIAILIGVPRLIIGSGCL